MSKKTTQPQSGSEAKPMFARQLLGGRVVNSSGEMLGTLDDIALGADGTVAYAVLSHGGVAGLPLGDKRFAVPFASLAFMQDAKGEVQMQLDATPGTLNQAPGFDADHPPLGADLSLARDMESAFAVSGK